MMNRVIVMVGLALTVSLSIQAIPKVHETIYLTKEEALENSFSKSAIISSETIHISESQRKDIEAKLGLKVDVNQFKLYKGTDPQTDQSLGYALILDEVGKHYPITMMIKVMNNLTVDTVQVMVYRERIGRQVKRRRFLKQFFGKTSDDPIRVDHDIDGISGATMSSWAVATAVKKALLITSLIGESK